MPLDRDPVALLRASPQCGWCLFDAAADFQASLINSTNIFWPVHSAIKYKCHGPSSRLWKSSRMENGPACWCCTSSIQRHLTCGSLGSSAIYYFSSNLSSRPKQYSKTPTTTFNRLLVRLFLNKTSSRSRFLISIKGRPNARDRDCESSFSCMKSLPLFVTRQSLIPRSD